MKVQKTFRGLSSAKFVDMAFVGPHCVWAGTYTLSIGDDTLDIYDGSKLYKRLAMSTATRDKLYALIWQAECM